MDSLATPSSQETDPVQESEIRLNESDAQIRSSQPIDSRPPLAFAVAIAVTVVAVAITGLLIPIPFAGLAAKAIGDMAHAPIFGGLALGTLVLLQRFRPLPDPAPAEGARSTRFRVLRRCIIVFFAFFFSGIAIEFMQAMSGRTSDVKDVFANSLGILAAILWWDSFFVRRVHAGSKRLVRLLWASSGFLLAMAWWGPMQVLHDVYKIRAEFPLLGSFETDTEFQRWYFRECKRSRSRADATHGRYSMEVTYPPGDSTMVTLVELEQDWSEMKTLEMDMTLDASYPREDLTFTIQVIDEADETEKTGTYRGEWTLAPGKPQHIVISRDDIVALPRDREIDLSKIRYVDLMVLDPQVITKIRFDNLRLVQ